MIRNGKLLPRVRTTEYFEGLCRPGGERSCCVQDIENLPEMQLGLVAEVDTAYVIINLPLNDHLKAIEDQVGNFRGQKLSGR